ncbi:MAG TPA: PepSY-associated TM helix domain-containing protein [Polyangiaceae bacterium]|nr:PepSY-associated TM helix domain-containing protein [Polyangiaceae bacterium]
MPDGTAEPTGPAAPAPARARRKLNFRPWLRALHRDVGYFAVGLTIVYAISGLAVNHLKDWDPNFEQVNRTHQLALPLPSDDAAAAKNTLQALKVQEEPREIYRASDTQLEIVFDKRTFHVDTTSGVVHEEGQAARPLLRVANWLHLNRGKKAWTYIADFYAVFLLFLALSGLFMIPGRKGLIGRGAVVALLGAAVPIAYVLLSGGP